MNSLAASVIVVCESPAVAQRLGVIRGLEVLQEEATEQPRKHPHGQEASRATGHPLRAVGRETAAWNHTVQMGMRDECLPPRVEHRKEPQLGPEMLGVSGDGSPGLGRRPKQEVVHGGFVVRRQGRHVLGHREDDVEVLDIEEIRCAGVDPGRASQRLTLGTMPIRAGNGELSISCLYGEGLVLGSRR